MKIAIVKTLRDQEMRVETVSDGVMSVEVYQKLLDREDPGKYQVEHLLDLEEALPEEVDGIRLLCTQCTASPGLDVVLDKLLTMMLCIGRSFPRGIK